MKQKFWSRLLLINALKTPTKIPTPIPQLSRKLLTLPYSPTIKTPIQSQHRSRNFCTYSSRESARIVQELIADVEKEKEREREDKKRAGIEINEDGEEEKDYMGVGPLIDKLQKEKEKLKNVSDELLFRYEEPSDSESDDDDDEEEEKLLDQFERKFQRHTDLLNLFNESGT